MSIGKVAEIDEVVVSSGGDYIAELEVAVDGGIGIGCGFDESGYALALFGCEERALVQEAKVHVLDVLKIGSGYVRAMECAAHAGKFTCILLDKFGIIADGTGE